MGGVPALSLRSVQTIELPTGERLPVLGQGTWQMGEKPGRRRDEVAALRLGLDLGLTVIDTAEMYADGGAEEVVGEALGRRRNEVFLVSKVLPQHATRAGTISACEHSLERLGTDHLDLYLLHWPGSVPLEATLAGFAALQDAGKIRHWGVSNFDLSDMQELMSLEGGTAVATNQVLYNLQRRGIERDLLPWSTARGIPIMAYSPVEQGRMLTHPDLLRMAGRLQLTPAQVAIAWVIKGGVMAIPKMGSTAHVRENRVAADLRLGEEDLAVLNRVFPAPSRNVPLETL
jgi:diketogulonate reductase-like aldo/keto reductase